MNFRDQKLGEFLDARNDATTLLKEQGVKRRSVSFEEALIMQAASSILSERDNFYGLEVIKLTGIESGVAYPTLNRFEEQYGIVTSTYEAVLEAAEQQRRPRRIFVPTDFGNRIFNLFAPETQVS